MTSRRRDGQAGKFVRATSRYWDSLRVRSSFRPRLTFSNRIEGASNPFVHALRDCLSKEFDVDELRYSKHLFGSSPSIFFVQWPESLFRGRGPALSCMKTLVFAVYAIRLKFAGTRFVELVHNLAPHEGSSNFERWAISTLRRNLDGAILLSPGDVEGSTAMVVIPHPHYRESISQLGDFEGRQTLRLSEDQGIQMLSFGQIRSYKGYEDAARLICASELPIRYSVVGMPVDQVLVARLETIARSNDKFRLVAGAVSDWELYEHVAACDVVLLPYGNFYNSGAAILALSLNTPIIAPRTDASESLASEFGTGWVRLYDPPLTAHKLSDLATALVPSEARVDMSRRDWSVISQQYHEFLFELLERQSLTTKRRLQVPAFLGRTRA